MKTYDIYKRTHSVSLIIVSNEAFHALFLFLFDKRAAFRCTYSMVWLQNVYS